MKYHGNIDIYDRNLKLMHTCNVEDRRTDFGVDGERFPETEKCSESLEEEEERVEIDLRVMNRQ